MTDCTKCIFFNKAGFFNSNHCFKVTPARHFQEGDRMWINEVGCMSFKEDDTK